jgi:hypothetical protein
MFTICIYKTMNNGGKLSVVPAISLNIDPDWFVEYWYTGMIKSPIGLNPNCL